MIFFTGSGIFERNFLEIESDKDILNYEYVLVSNRIRTSLDPKNDKIEYDIVNASKKLYPTIDVLAAESEDEYRIAYMRQLDKAKYYIAVFIKYAVKNPDKNIIFLCSEKEMRLKYFWYLTEYIQKTFHYPMYNYAYYVCGCVKPRKFKQKKVLKICKKVMKERVIYTKK